MVDSHSEVGRMTTGRLRTHALFGCIALVLLVIGTTCRNVSDSDAPDNCIQVQPTKGRLTVKLTVSAQSAQVPLTVYYGDIEDERIVTCETVDEGTVDYELPVNERYSVTALYISGPDTVLVVDGDDIKAEQRHYRNATCWEISNGTIDVRLQSDLSRR